jgi:hypothetical protein
MITGYRKVAILAICAVILSSMSLAISAPKDKGKNSQNVKKTTDVDVHVGVDIFMGKDREIIQQYFHNHAESLPPGLAKRGGNLPPGLAKQLRRKGHLPPGLEKKVAAFPVELERRLPPLKAGLVRGVIEGRAVIYNPKASVILDIFAVF